MLQPLTAIDATRLRDFLLGAGYTEAELRKQQYFSELPSSRLRNFPRLLDRTSDRTCLNTLLRWFWLGVPQDATDSANLLPGWFVPLALSLGLLRQDGSQLAAPVMLFPVKDFLLACDHTSRIDACDPELVLWPNPTSKLLSQFTVRRKSRATLDLGTGNGIQALMAAVHSEKVIATDLNPRAVNFTQFTAVLNGLDNIECLAGDGFAPVAQRKFDLIVSNPPFFISPGGRYLFCDNPMDLDQLCRRFVREASGHLNEGGYFQLLCEWAEVRGQPWQERVTEWLKDTGCDAWVLKGHTQDPAEYAQHRIAETVASPEGDAQMYAEYLAYYREREVQAIHDGVIAMRRRSGQNWTLIEEITDIPKDAFGECVAQAFTARDFLREHASDEQLLAVKPRLSSDCRLEQFFQPGDGQWQPASLTLRLVKGLPFFVGLQAPVAGFLSGCTGTRPVSELIADFAHRVDAPAERVHVECLGIVRKLIERGFLLC
jgi:SAM-dependent methyltransferase